LQQAELFFVAWCCNQLSELEDVQAASALHRLTASEPGVLRAIGLGPTPGSLREVAYDGLRRSNELVSAIRVPLRQQVDEVADQGEEFDGTLIDTKALEAQPVILSNAVGNSCVQSARSSKLVVPVHVAVAVKVHDNGRVRSVAVDEA